MTKQERLPAKAVCTCLRFALGEEMFRQIAEQAPPVWRGEWREPPLP